MIEEKESRQRKAELERTLRYYQLSFGLALLSIIILLVVMWRHGIL